MSPRLALLSLAAGLLAACGAGEIDEGAMAADSAQGLTAPAPVGAISASALSSSSIEVDWTDTSRETGYVVERSLAAGSGFATVARLPADTTRFVDTALAPMTAYFYRVYATGRGGRNSARSAVVSATTLAGSAPDAGVAAADASVESPDASAGTPDASVGTPDAGGAPSGACVPIPAIGLTGYDPLPALQKARITSGPFAGGYTVAVGDARLNWYFASLGLLGFVDRIPADVRAYLDLYLANLSADYSIKDVFFDEASGVVDFGSYSYQANGVGKFSDSDDSYAATLLSLAVRYYFVTCDAAWLASTVPGRNVTVLSALKSIATNNLVKSQWPNGLVHVFQDASAYFIAYTEDNAEAYRGLMDLALLLQALQDPAATTYSDSAARIAAAMQGVMFTTNLKSGSSSLGLAGFYFYWGDGGSFTGPAEPLNSPLAFYPDGASQIFPQAYRMGLPQASYDAGWAFLNAKFPSYTTTAYSWDPWTVIGWAAALQGNWTLASQMQAKTVNVYMSGGVVPINNWSFHRRISLLAQQGIVY